MATNLPLAQSYAFSLAQTLQVPVTVFRTEAGFSVVTSDEFEGDGADVVTEFDPTRGERLARGRAGRALRALRLGPTSAGRAGRIEKRTQGRIEGGGSEERAARCPVQPYPAHRVVASAHDPQPRGGQACDAERLIVPCREGMRRRQGATAREPRRSVPFVRRPEGASPPAAGEQDGMGGGAPRIRTFE
jgi:hypothetical protein